MESPLNVVGFSKAHNKNDIEDIIEGILKNPSRQKAIELTSEVIFAEYMQKLAENTYTIVRVRVRKGEEDPEVTVYDCDAFIEATHHTEIEEVVVERGDEFDDEDTDYYVVCEEKESSMEIVFVLQNIVEYLEGIRNDLTIKQVNMVGVASEGTIILPIEKDEEEEQLEQEEKEKLRTMLQKMKSGDEEAREILEQEEKDLDTQLKERLKEEDFLTVMSGYFMPATSQDAVYAVLGDILQVRERRNKITGEEMYVFTLNVNDMHLEVVVHKEELIGMPSVGMRFMGTCWMQGQVIMG